MAVLTIGLLGGCSNDASRPSQLAQLQQVIAALGTPEPGPNAGQIRDSITPEVQAQFGGAELQIAAIEKPPLASVLIEVGQNGPVTTFTTPDGVSFGFRNGVLVATRGLGNDLMSADARQTEALLMTQGTGNTVRIHRFLDGQDQLFVRSFVCQITRAGPQIFRETCAGKEIQFENTYRFDLAGQIVSSRQWISPERGYVTLEDV